MTPGDHLLHPRQNMVPNPWSLRDLPCTRQNRVRHQKSIMANRTRLRQVSLTTRHRHQHLRLIKNMPQANPSRAKITVITVMGMATALIK